MKMGHAREPALRRITADHPRVLPGGVFQVGMLRNTRYPYICASPDGMACVAFPRADGSGVDVHHVPVEIKTFAGDDGSIDVRRKHFSDPECQGHLTTVFGSDHFVRVVPEKFWGQLVHQLMTVAAEAIIITMGTSTDWLATVLCIMPPENTWATNAVLGRARYNPNDLVTA